MSKFLLLLPALALIGAGCASSTQVETTADTSTQADSSGLVVEQVPAEQDADSPTAEANAKGELVIKSDGAEVVVQTETDAAVEEEDGVPVTDVVLGAKADVEISMEGGNFFFAPKTINAKPGEKVKITFTKNVGFHTFVIDELGVKYAIKQGESMSFTAPKTAGSYAFYCDVGSHRANGMEGVLVVK